MATTDAKPGFRLPWSSERNGSDDPAGTDAAETSGETSQPTQEIETPEMIDAAPAATDNEAVVESTAPADPTPHAEAAPTSPVASSPAPAAAGKKPNKFMADLTKAMQAAAETAREDSLARFAADAKTHIETIHADSATEATDLRKQADDDLAAIREWSKAEIARIREETDERISHRKTTLEQELEEHAAAVEARVARVQARVDAFEAEMAAFFERLLAEDDPTRFAAMAETLPEPPPFDGPAPDRTPVEVAVPTADAMATTADEPTTDPVVAEGSVEQPTAPDVDASAWGAPESTSESTAESTATLERDPAWDAGATGPAEADQSAETAVATAPGATTDAGDLFGAADGPTDASADGIDPRVSALGLSPDFAAAEAEAAAFTTDGSSDEEIPEIADEAIAARLTGLVPDGDAAPSVTTRVVVTGLISVASIAGFKRHLSRADGVQSVGVSSGPDGEFVFAVNHGADVALRDVIPTLPGFGARVTAESEGELTVAASDPEAES